RVSYSPSAIRLVRLEVTGSGTEATTFKAPCMEHTVRHDCPRARRVINGRAFRFFGSGRNEISFRPARLPDVPGACPRQSPPLRAIRPGLQHAQGELSEAALTDPRVSGQTA